MDHYRKWWVSVEGLYREHERILNTLKMFPKSESSQFGICENMPENEEAIFSSSRDNTNVRSPGIISAQRTLNRDSECHEALAHDDYLHGNSQDDTSASGSNNEMRQTVDEFINSLQMVRNRRVPVNFDKEKWYRVSQRLLDVYSRDKYVEPTSIGNVKSKDKPNQLKRYTTRSFLARKSAFEQSNDLHPHTKALLGIHVDIPFDVALTPNSPICPAIIEPGIEEKMLDDATRCSICSDNGVNESNFIVACSCCNFCAHQRCYAIHAIPIGDWFCDICILHGFSGSYSQERGPFRLRISFRDEYVKKTNKKLVFLSPNDHKDQNQSLGAISPQDNDDATLLFPIGEHGTTSSTASGSHIGMTTKIFNREPTSHREQSTPLVNHKPTHTEPILSFLADMFPSCQTRDTSSDSYDPGPSCDKNLFDFSIAEGCLLCNQGLSFPGGGLAKLATLSVISINKRKTRKRKPAAGKVDHIPERIDAQHSFPPKKHRKVWTSDCNSGSMRCTSDGVNERFMFTWVHCRCMLISVCTSQSSSILISSPREMVNRESCSHYSVESNSIRILEEDVQFDVMRIRVKECWFHRRCSICGDNQGVTTQCTHSQCFLFFHLSCSVLGYFKMTPKGFDPGPLVLERCSRLCPIHSKETDSTSTIGQLRQYLVDDPFGFKSNGNRIKRIDMKCQHRRVLDGIVHRNGLQGDAIISGSYDKTAEREQLMMFFMRQLELVPMNSYKLFDSLISPTLRVNGKHTKKLNSTIEKKPTKKTREYCGRMNSKRILPSSDGNSVTCNDIGEIIPFQETLFPSTNTYTPEKAVGHSEATGECTVCNKPWSPTIDGSLLIGCDKCQEWFHDKCAGLESNGSIPDGNWYCDSCTRIINGDVINDT